MFTFIKKMFSDFHKDENGADMVEYILIIAAVGLPLLAVIIWFWQDISKAVDDWWGQIRGSSGSATGTLDPGNL